MFHGLGFGNVWECRSMFGYVPWFGVWEGLGMSVNVFSWYSIMWISGLRAEG